MAHLYAMYKGKNEYPIIIEGDGCLYYEGIDIFMNSK